jgi:translation initiation factor 2B subunit (eIF-2B alpha/beta/delta family)
MGRRDKNRFEKWFSISRHKRRAGAIELSEQISMDFAKQKSKLIENDEIIYTHGSSNSIEEHFNALKNEFSGQLMQKSLY